MKDTDRRIGMYKLWEAGYTLGKIGEQFNVTRERVRQLIEEVISAEIDSLATAGVIFNVKEFINKKKQLHNNARITASTGKQRTRAELRIIANTEEEVIADYFGKERTVENIRIKGDFRDIGKAREEVATYLLTKKIINAGQFLGFISAIKNPRSKDFYSKIGKKGMANRCGKK